MGLITQRSAIGRTYLTLVPWAGGAVLAFSLVDLVLHPPDPSWLALATLTVLTGSFTVKIPGLVARLSVSEPFVFAATLWFGPSVGAVTAALDALIMSLWLLPGLKTFHRLAFNVSVLVISIWLSSQLFFLMSGIDSRSPSYGPLSYFVVPLYIFTACCFLLNSGMIAGALSIERAQPALRIWRQQFLWLSLNYFGGASVAALLVVYARQLDWPVIGIIVPLLVISYLTFRTTLGRLDDANEHLQELNRLYLSTIETLAMAVDAKDQVTHGHIRRVQRYALGLATELGTTDSRHLKAMEAAALLHDMGKLAVPEYILNKPGRLTDGEFEKMKLHASIGADILSSIEFPYPVVPIVRHHHENWDGSGYPDRLRGTAIPLGARILSVVDCYDALTSDRPYRPRLSPAKALEVILARRGSMYDPIVVDKFVEKLALLEASVANLEPESPTLKQIAELSAVPNTPRSESITSAVTAFPDSLGSGVPLVDLAKLVLGHVVGSMRADGCILYRLTEAGTSIHIVSIAGAVPAGYLGQEVGIGNRAAGWVAATGSSILNAAAELDLVDKALGTGQVVSGILCPVNLHGRTIGVLTLYSKGVDAFSKRDQETAQGISIAIAAALSRRNLADTPSTIEYPPPVAYSSAILAEVSVAANSSAWLPLGVVAVQSGSSDHREVALTLRATVRTGDSVFEAAPGSSLILLRNGSEYSTKQAVERIRRECSEKGLKVELAWAVIAELDERSDSQISALVDEARRRAELRGLQKPH